MRPYCARCGANVGKGRAHTLPLLCAACKRLAGRS